jgi:hypothetical protein
LGTFLCIAFGQLKHVVSLASHYKLLGFFIVNDGAKINSCNPQIMRCIVCHCYPIDVNAINVSHEKNKCLLNYNKDHGTSSLKKLVFHEHVEECKRWDLFLVQKAQGDGPQGETTKKRKNIPPFLIIEFFGTQQPYNKIDPTQHAFFEDLILYIMKGYHPLSSIENSWLRRMVLTQHMHVKFPFQH